MLKGPWICDTCGQEIKSADEGYTAWQTDDNLKAFDFKIFHKGKCDHYRGSSLPLTDLVGQEGIVNLTALLSIGKIKLKLGETGSCYVKDLDEFVDFFRRLQLENYEQARIKFSNPKLLDDFDDHNEVSPYIPSKLKNISEKY